MICIVSVDNEREDKRGKRTVVDEGSDDLRFGPFGFRIVLLCESVPTAVVSDRYLCEVVLQNGLMEVDNKLRGREGS